MTILEIIAEQTLGTRRLASHSQLRTALQHTEQAVQKNRVSQEEKTRITSIVELCFAHKKEKDRDEKANILRTLEEITENKALELSAESLEEWAKNLTAKKTAVAKARRKIFAT